MSRNLRKWDFDKPKDFREQVKILPQSVKPKLTEVMRTLSESNNPLVLGKKKITKYGIFYAIKLDDCYRLSYNISSHKNNSITIYRIGTHFQVYGKK